MANQIETDLKRDWENPRDRSIMIIAAVITIGFVIYYFWSQAQAASAAASSAASGSDTSTEVPPYGYTVGQGTDTQDDTGTGSDTGFSTALATLQSEITAQNTTLQQALTTGLQTIETTVTNQTPPQQPSATINLSYGSQTGYEVSQAGETGSGETETTSSSSGGGGLSLTGLGSLFGSGSSNSGNLTVTPSQANENQWEYGNETGQDLTATETGYSASELNQIIGALQNEADEDRNEATQISSPWTNQGLVGSVSSTNAPGEQIVTTTEPGQTAPSSIYIYPYSAATTGGVSTGNAPTVKTGTPASTPPTTQKTW